MIKNRHTFFRAHQSTLRPMDEPKRQYRGPDLQPSMRRMRVEALAPDYARARIRQALRAVAPTHASPVTYSIYLPPPGSIARGFFGNVIRLR